MPKYDWVKKIDLARFSPRERVLMVATATAVAVFLLAYIYLPAHRQALALAQEHEQLKQELVGLERQLDEAQKSSQWMKRLKQDQSTESVQIARPYGESLSLILEELNRLAGATATDFFSVRPEKVEEKGTLQAQSVLIDLRSTFKSMGKYLQMLENLPRMIHIRNLKVEADPSEASHVLIHLYLTMYLEKD
jgi:Tfp pilus assembly protein PilO